MMANKSLSPGREDSTPVDSPLVRRAAVSLLLGVPTGGHNDSVASWSMEDLMTDDSSHTSPLWRHGSLSPASNDTRRQHSNNELWAAIQPDFMYLMDEEIIDACKVICIQWINLLWSIDVICGLFQEIAKLLNFS